MSSELTSSFFPSSSLVTVALNARNDSATLSSLFTTIEEKSRTFTFVFFICFPLSLISTRLTRLCFSFFGLVCSARTPSRSSVEKLRVLEHT